MLFGFLQDRPLFETMDRVSNVKNLQNYLLTDVTCQTNSHLNTTRMVQDCHRMSFHPTVLNHMTEAHIFPQIPVLTDLRDRKGIPKCLFVPRHFEYIPNV